MSTKSVPTRDEYLNRLRLAVEQSLTTRASSRGVAAVTGVSHTTVCLIRKKAEETGLDWSALSGMAMDALYALAASPNRRKERKKELPDFEYIAKLMTQPGMTRERLHDEHKLLYGERALSYSHFCLLLAKHRRPERATMTQKFDPGYRMEIDFSGDRPVWMDRQGKLRKAELLCACLPCSGYSFACLLPSQDVHWTISAMLRVFAFLGGVTRVIVPDNFKAAVLESGTEKLKIQPDFLRMAQAHDVAVLPARPRSPTHKGSVEEGVKRMQRYLLPELAMKTYRSFEQLDAEVARLVEVYNDLPLSEVLLGTRREEFEQREKVALRPLPNPRYVHRHSMGRLKVPANFRLRVLDNNYSVPFELVGQHVEPVVVNNAIEIWHEGELVAFHDRLFGKLGYSLKPEHEKAAHRAQRMRDRKGIEAWSRDTGPNIEAFVSQLFASEVVGEQALPAAQALHSACQDKKPDYLERVARAAFKRKATSVTEFIRLMRLMRNDAFVDPARPKLLSRESAAPRS